VTLGKAVLHREPDDQYTLLIFKRSNGEAEEHLETSTPNLTLSNAFNAARDALAAMAVNPDKHQLITITTRIS
jgi:hypothetical protein